MCNKLQITVNNRLEFNYKLIPKELFTAIKILFTYKNPRFYKEKSMGYYTKTPELIKSYYISDDNISIARGTRNKLELILKENNIEFEYIDKTISIPCKFKSKIKLRDYQKESFDQLVEKGNGLIQGVCGCGKTIILLKVIEAIGQKTIIIVHEQKLQMQWIDEIHKLFGLPLDEIGMIGGIAKKPVIKNITVALQQSLLRNVDKYKSEFGLVVCDEVHHFASSTFSVTVDAFKAKYRIGGTATPKRKDQLQFIMFDELGEILSIISDKNLLELDMIHDVKIVIVYTDFIYTGEYKEMINKVYIGNDDNGFAIFDNQVTEFMVHNEFLDKITKNAKRNKLIFRFLDAEVKNKQYCLLLADRREFCFNWKTWLSYKNIEAKLLMGGEKEDGIEVVKRMNKGDDLYVAIGTTVADEGLNIPRLSRGFSATPSGSNERRIIQQVGRIKRKCKGKKDAIWYYFLDYKNESIAKHEKLLKKYFNTVEVLQNKEDIDKYINSISKGE